MSEKEKEGVFRREYRSHGEGDVSDSLPAYVSVDMVHGSIRVYSADEYARTTPVLVGCFWHMRWPIPPIGNSAINALIDRLAPHAENLFKMCSVRDEPLGVILYAGAGTSVDLIQQECADVWRSWSMGSEKRG
ncbi:hypothetical protein [Streptomyces sp. NBC_00078]|uniref:hypothetical protein n=1 Tax=Streptomyces sp. NBC_00078 TaxID=2975643 RepID=UPI00224D719A|nr:hypothetical protein [Streptomyces sp. NBC_00078]MCX5426086.1 hypothetical protein [Streptomyces sp. NBC_00078]